MHLLLKVMQEEKSIFTAVEFGKRLKSLRKHHKVTQIELSDRLDIDDGSLRRIESGRTNPTLLTISKIAQALRTPLWIFFLPLQQFESFLLEEKEKEKVKN